MLSVSTFKKKAGVFWKIPLYFKLMFFVNFFLCGVARFIICIIPLPRYSSYLGQYYDQLCMSTLLPAGQKNLALQLGRSVRLAAKYTPWNSNCLTQAMVAAFWCKRLGIPYVFYIGLCPSVGGTSTDFLAHAWVKAGPIAITGGDCFATHRVIATYSSMDSH